MNYHLDKSKPLCPQICEQICSRIALGDYLPNEKLLSVRECALNIGVTPNTVQRAYEILEGQGILYSQRGSGWYVSEDTTYANKILDDIIKEKAAAFIASMKALGYDLDEVKDYVKEWEN